MSLLKRYGEEFDALFGEIGGSVEEEKIGREMKKIVMSAEDEFENVDEFVEAILKRV